MDLFFGESPQEAFTKRFKKSPSGRSGVRLLLPTGPHVSRGPGRAMALVPRGRGLPRVPRLGRAMDPLPAPRASANAMELSLEREVTGWPVGDFHEKPC